VVINSLDVDKGITMLDAHPGVGPLTALWRGWQSRRSAMKAGRSRGRHCGCGFARSLKLGCVTATGKSECC
jgi:hypothetical protein